MLSKRVKNQIIQKIMINEMKEIETKIDLECKKMSKMKILLNQLSNEIVEI